MSGNSSSSALFHFRDKQEYDAANQVPILTIDIDKSHVEMPDNYTKKKNVFRLITEVGSECLYHANSQEVLEYWLDAIRHLHMTRNAAMALNTEGMKEDASHNLSPPDNVSTSEAQPNKRDYDQGSQNSQKSVPRASTSSGRSNQRKSSVLEKLLNRKSKQ